MINSTDKYSFKWETNKKKSCWLIKRLIVGLLNFSPKVW
jgi:hypothetical protein